MDCIKLLMSYLVVFIIVNFNNVMYGGELLNLLDKVVYVCLICYCVKGMVILSVDGVIFKYFIFVGNLFIFLVSINYVGNTLCEVGIKVLSEDIKICEIMYINFCYFIMVVVENGKFIFMFKYEFKIEVEICCYEGVLKCKEMCI